MANTPSTATKSQGNEAARKLRDDVVDGAEGVAADAKAAGRRALDEAQGAGEEIARTASDLASSVGERLRAAGVDTDRVVDVAREQAGDLQRMIEDEIRERPLRALGLAAAVGLFVGFLSAR